MDGHASRRTQRRCEPRPDGRETRAIGLVRACLESGKFDFALAPADTFFAGNSGLRIDLLPPTGPMIVADGGKAPYPTEWTRAFSGLLRGPPRGARLPGASSARRAFCRD